MAAAAKRATEPAVISLHLIRSALDSADVEDAAPGELVRPPVALPQAEYLRLSFRSLLKIQNLDVLRSLKHLKLDNNGITVIEGLDCLASTLEQLDLSFNAIESMDGLDALARLTDLSLFNNRIKQVAVIDACPALQCVSLGNNLLEDLLGTVLFLRRVAPLQVLTLEGNPLCRQGEGGRDMYRPHVFAFIPKLKYLDYNFVTDADRLAAREGGVPSEKLAEVEEADAATAEALKKERARAEQLADYVAANLEVVETITGDMFSDGGEDQEWTKLKTMPSLPHQLLALRELLKPLIDELRTTGMDKDAKIREEAGQFTEAYTAVVADANAHALAAFNEWDAALASARGARQKAVAAGGGAALAAANAALEALKLRCEEVVSDVLKREMELHEMVESMLDVLDSSLGELRFGKLASQDAFFRGVEAAEAKFTELLAKEGEALAAGVASGVVTDLEKELGALARDKEALAGALAGAHEARVARILRREGDLKQREEKRCTGLVAGARATEIKRNRDRVTEAFALGEAGRARVSRALAGEEGVLVGTVSGEK